MGTATKKTPLNIHLGGAFSGMSAIPVWVDYDTPGEDLIISTPSRNQQVCLLGLEGVKGAAWNPIFKSAGNTIFKMELSANSARAEALCPSHPRVICNTEPGEALKLNCDVTLPPFLMYIVEV